MVYYTLAREKYRAIAAEKWGRGNKGDTERA